MNENENTTTQNLWNSVKAVLREIQVHRNTSLPQETGEKSNKSSKPNFTLKVTIKRTNDEP